MYKHTLARDKWKENKWECVAAATAEERAMTEGFDIGRLNTCWTRF